MAKDKIHIFFATKVRGGGTLSYMGHIKTGFEKLGHEVELLSVVKKPRQGERPQGKGLVAREIGVADAVKIAKKQLAYIGTAYPPDPEIVQPLRRHCVVVAHGGTVEISRKALEIYGTEKPIITIRQAFRGRVEGGIYVPYPYARFRPKRKRDSTHHAINLSRITASKRINILLDANRLLPKGKQIQLFGFNNRMYAHFNLEQSHPDWQDWYLGELDKEDPASGAKAAAKASYVIDMTDMKNDGGEPQFVHFEALDAGANLILNKKWITGVEKWDELSGVAQYAEDGKELAKILMAKTPRTLTSGKQEKIEEIFRKHDAKRVAKKTLKVLEKYA